MARKGSGLGTVVKVVKAIDRAQKQAARDAERQRKQQEREEAKRQREYEQMHRQREREQVALGKAQFKKEIERAKIAYENRCLERQNLRNEIINQELK